MVHPPGEAENHRAAAIMATIANYAGRSLKDGQRVRPSDFLVKKDDWLQTAEEQFALLKGLGNA